MKNLISLCALALCLGGCGGDGATRHVVLPHDEADRVNSGAWTIIRQPAGSPSASPDEPEAARR